MYVSTCTFVMHYRIDSAFNTHTLSHTHTPFLTPSLTPFLSRFVMHYGIDPALYRDKLLDAAYQALEGAGGFPASHPGGAGGGVAGGVMGSGQHHAFGQQQGRSFGAEEDEEEEEGGDEEEADADDEGGGEDGDPDGEELEEGDDDESWADDESAPEDPAYDSMSPPPSDPATPSEERVYPRQNNQQRRPPGNRDAASHLPQARTRAPLPDRIYSTCLLFVSLLHGSL